MNILSYLQKRGEMVDAEIDKLIPEDLEPKKLADASRHLIEAGGKRLRPALTLTASKAVGGKVRNALKVAAALEILHTFTLIHDDIMDQDDFRRGAKTAHKAWDEPMAIIAGDALFAKVFEALSESVESEGLPADKIIQLFEIVSDTSFKICQGQTLDMEFEKREMVTESEYLEMVEKKTGALIEASTRTGALMGGGTREEIDALAEYGRLLGIAFQIHDDLLGVAGEEEKIGKPVGSDIRESKWTFLAVHAYEEASQKNRDILLRTLGRGNASDEEAEKVVKIFRETGAIDLAMRKSQDLIDRAKSKLDVIHDSEAKNFLIELADFSIEREH